MSANTATSTVDASNNGVGGDDSSETNQWILFVQALFTYFIITLLVGLFGANFIYLTTRGGDLDLILPTDEQFYSAKTYQTNQPGAFHVVDCTETSSGNFPILQDNFPYNLILIKGQPTKEQLKQLSFTERLTNWFAKVVAGSMKSNRALLKGWLDCFNPNGLFGNHVFQIYFAAPFTIFVSLFALVSGWIAAFGAGFSTDLKVTVWGGFLLYSWGLFGGIACIVFMKLISTLLFFPPSQNFKEVTNIMACNVKPLVVLFGFFACGVAYNTLDPTIAGVMGIVYIMLVAWTMIKYFRGQLH